MNIYLACYDAGAHPVDGSFWTWHHTDLKNNLLDQFYYNVASKHLPLPSTESAHFITSPKSLCGGCAGISGEWACWYRFADGGNDVHGRPGRIVLLAAFFKKNDGAQNNTSGILRHRLFQEYVRQAKSSCPMPRPASLELLIPSVHSEVDSAVDPENWKLLREQSRLDINGENAIIKIGNIIANIPPGTNFDCTVQSDAMGEQASITLPPGWEPITKEAEFSHNLLDDSDMGIKPLHREVSVVTQYPKANQKGSGQTVQESRFGFSITQQMIFAALSILIVGLVVGFAVGFVVGRWTGKSFWKKNTPTPRIIHVFRNKTLPKTQSALQQQGPQILNRSSNTIPAPVNNNAPKPATKQ